MITFLSGTFYLNILFANFCSHCALQANGMKIRGKKPTQNKNGLIVESQIVNRKGETSSLISTIECFLVDKFDEKANLCVIYWI